MLSRLRFQLVCMVGVCFLLFLVYFQALGGPFLLDDITSVLPARVDVLSFSELKRVAFADASGPFGRFIPVASFALNYYFWGESAFSYKVVNLVLHTVNFYLVLHLVIILCQLSERSATKKNALTVREIHLLAFVCSFLWALHPMQVSTVMYVVQRMAMLSAMFSLSAMLVYLFYRDRIRTKRDTIVWVAAIAGLTALSCLCKEIGILTVLYIGLFELLFFPQSLIVSAKFIRRRPFIIWGSMIAVFPMLLVFQKLMLQYEFRDFSLTERLISQVQILTNVYLKNIVLPSLDELSVHHDGYIPKSDVDLNFIFSLLIVSVVIGIAIFVRKRHPIISIGVGLFVVSHLLESTFLPLELVFEHRNYLAILGVCLCVVYVVWMVVRARMVQPLLVALLIALPVIVISQQTYFRSLEWSSKEALVNAALVNKPLSLRAKMSVTEALAGQGRLNELLIHLSSSAKQHPENSIFRVQQVMFTGALGITNATLLKDTSDLLETAPLRMTDVKALLELHKFRSAGRFQWPSSEEIADLFGSAVRNENKKINFQSQVVLYGKYSDLLLANGRVKKASEALAKGMEIAPSSVELNIRLAKVYLVEGKNTLSLNAIQVAKTFNGSISLKNLREIELVESKLGGLK